MNSLEKENIHLLENLSNFKEEVANSLEFARILSSGVDIFVNDSFSNCHKVLASTVGVTRFCYTCIAGFHFEERLDLLKNLAEASTKPYVAIVCPFLLLMLLVISNIFYIQESLKYFS